jgi:hypothetical protein
VGSQRLSASAMARPLRDARYRYECNITIDFWEILYDVVEFISLTQDGI